MTPLQFKPKMASDFIGCAAMHAKIILAKAERLVSSHDGNYRLLLHGFPGCGKSSLAQIVAQRLAGNPVAVEHCNGQGVDVELVRRWRERCAYMPMWGSRTVKVIDECDAMGPAALNEYRTFSDCLPPCVDIILTTNKRLEHLQPQLQSRCQQYRFMACPVEALADWLAKRWGLPPDHALKTAVANKGDIRAALNDAESFMDNIAAKIL